MLKRKENRNETFCSLIHMKILPGVPQNVFVVLSIEIFSLHIPKSAVKGIIYWLNIIKIIRMSKMYQS